MPNPMLLTRYRKSETPPCPMIDLTAGRFRRIITDMIYMTATHTFSRCLMTSTQAGLRERCAW